MQSWSADKMKNLVIMGCFIMAICQVEASAPNKLDCANLTLTRTLPELVKMADNDETYDEALAVFKCKYSETTFTVRVLEDIANTRRSAPFQVVNPKNIKILNSEFLVDFVRLFSIHMHAFTFDLQHTPIPLAKKVLRLIRSQSESLVHLDLLNSKGAELSESDIPFETVRSLSVSGQWTKWGGKTVNFAQLFPNLRRLDFKTQGFSIENEQEIVQVYPKLEELHISINQSADVQGGVFSEGVVADLLRLNPTIHTLALDYCSESFLNEINSALPNLESLRLIDIHETEDEPYIGDDIVMENVRNFEIVSLRTSRRVLRQTTFPQLIQLQLELSTVVNDELNMWFHFISIHKKIAVLKALGFVRDGHLLKFRKELPELTHLVVKCDRSISTMAMVFFVKKNTQLIYFELRGVPNLRTHTDDLSGQFTEEWRIEPLVKERRLIISRRM